MNWVKTGDTIGVAAPSARFDEDRFQKGISCLEEQGFNVHVPEGIFEKKRYLAGGDTQRADILNQLFLDPAIKGIIAARGGFGSMRILNRLDFKLMAANPKPVIGFSDITALLNGLVQGAGLMGIHGPNLTSLGQAPPETLSSFVAALGGRPQDIMAEQAPCLVPGRAEGQLKGGNLATLSHLMGTAFQPRFNGAVFFLEDVGEPAYKIDRMLSQMKMAGLFEGIRAVVAGSFEQCENPDYIPEILLDIFEPFGVPVLMGLASGHGRQNLSLVLGRTVRVDAGTGTLEWI